MALDGTTIAAIITGILALLGALGAAWMSGLNEHRTEARANKKALARYSVPLIIAAWDLANWFYDITNEDYYSPKRCEAYGDGWDSEFTSYLIGQYFAGVHIIREMTHFFAHIRSTEAEKLKKLLWKIQDEFISMHEDGRESLEMRWFEGDILAAQEHLTEDVNSDCPGNPRELRIISWIEFQKKYEQASEAGDKKSPQLCNLFEWYEDEFQRIIYRRFRSLYEHKWSGVDNRPDFEKKLNEGSGNNLQAEKEMIEAEQLKYPNIIIVPDHRVRRLQHLLSDLVVVLDSFTTMKLNRPVRRCNMSVEYNISASKNPLGLVTSHRVRCDCSDRKCNPENEDFDHRNFYMKKEKERKNPPLKSGIISQSEV
jgi:hypothetical protein